MDLKLNWIDQLHFHYEDHEGAVVEFDSEAGGVSPMQMLLISVAACTAMDVISILEKKRQKVTSYSVTIHGDRPPEGTWPRPFTKIKINHELKGENIDRAAVERAIQLSEEKYCSVSATLKESPEVINEWQVS